MTDTRTSGTVQQTALDDVTRKDVIRRCRTNRLND
jgi:hypothetical protein